MDNKMKLVKLMEMNLPIFTKRSDIRFSIRCPICGDSNEHPDHTHCYIKCGYDPNEPLLYKCFLCNSKGKVDKWFLKQLGITDKSILDLVSDVKYNKIGSIKQSDPGILTGDVNLNSKQVEYIESRLGKGLTAEDYDKFKIVWDLNNIYDLVSNKVKNTLPNNTDSISFLSDDKSTLIIRTMKENSSERWRKVRLNNSDNRIFYTIKSMVNLFSQDKIYVNIAEGIFDVLSIYKNFNTGNDSAYIATLWIDNIGAMDYAMMKGFVGSNVIVKIYIDSNINYKDLIRKLKQHKWKFGSIFVYKNIIGKDIGVNIKDIKLAEFKV